MRMNRIRKSVAAVMAVALSVTLVPGQGRCDDMPHANVVMMVIELAKPKKQEYKKPAPAVASPCCPGAAVMPCCPIAHMAVTSTCVPVQAPTCSACPVHKPEVVATPCCPMVHPAVTCEVRDLGIPVQVPCMPPHVQGCSACPFHKPETVAAPYCVIESAACCKAEPVINEMRALCAEQTRTLHELQFTIKSLKCSIELLQGQVRMLQDNEGSVPVPCKVPPIPKQESGHCQPFKFMPKTSVKPVVNH